MKKIIALILVMLLSLTLLCSCEMVNQLINPDSGSSEDGDNNDLDNDRPDTPSDDESGNDENPDTPDKEEEPNDGGEKPDDEPTKDEPSFIYNSFTPSEKSSFNEMFGEVIPFAPNNEYYVEEYTYEYEDCYEKGLNFYTYGNTKADFDAYRLLFSIYTYDGSEKDEYGDDWYYYSNDGYFIDISYYETDNGYVIDVYVYRLYDYENGGNVTDGNYIYNKFTSAEESMFTEMLGEVIPFAPNNEYYVEEYTYEYEDCYEVGLNFYTYGNTKADFDAYKSLFSGYTYDGSDKDEYGDDWYYYSSDDGYFIDISYYETEKGYVIDVYAYFLYDYDDEGGNGGNTGDNGESGDNGEDSSNIITNAGAGLPTGTNGVYDVDFTDGKYVQDVTDQGYYIDGCPTTGSPAVLVIPVDFSDINGRNNGYSIANIERAFKGGDGSTDYYSVHDYYYISSYGKLDLDITVLDHWFVPSKTSSYYENATMDYYGDNVAIGDQMVLDEALAYLSTFMDLSEYDSDGNGIIDAVVLVTTLEIDADTDFNWAYRYWNIYTDDDGYYYEYDGVSANDYIWVPYSFMHESYNAAGDSVYTDTSVMNTYTFIHEFGHVLGADDYYNTADSGDHPMDGCDVMDSMAGDHNAFTKFNLGWLTTSRLVTTDESITLTLEAFSKSGDTIIIANNYDPTLGAYQEYYIVVYYTANGLNGDGYGYFSREGIVVYHINASLYSEDYEGETYYDIYNNNTDPSDQYGTEDNLIEFVKSQAGNYTYVAGDRISSTKDDQGNKLSYTFVVDSISGDYATITFTKI